MKIYTTLKIGSYHSAFCEDFLFHQKIDDRFYIAAVMDGCSSGTDCHFASTLIGKILRKIVSFFYLLPIEQTINLDDYNAKSLTKYILQALMKELAKAKNELLLNRNELLATLILMIYDKKDNKAFIIVLGDGFVAINGEITEIDQNNRPDYPAYHLGEPFEFWFESQKNTFWIENPKDISLSTDGIDSFIPTGKPPKRYIHPPTYFLVNTQFLNNTEMFHQKWIHLTENVGLQNYDDLGIIRILFYK